MDVITGKTRPKSGKAVATSQDLTQLEPAAIARRGLAASFRNRRYLRR